MSIEALMTELRDALNANTEALKAAASGAAVAEKVETKAAGKGKAEKKEEAPKITQEQVNAALIKIKEDFGMDKAKEGNLKFVRFRPPLQKDGAYPHIRLDRAMEFLLGDRFA